MKCQNLFSGKNKENINLSSAEFAERSVNGYMSRVMQQRRLTD